MRSLYDDYIYMLYQLVKMSVTAANLIEKIRVDKATQKGSVHDVIN